MERGGFVFKQGADDLDVALAGGKHRAARQVEGRILGVIARHGLEAALAQPEHDAADACPINCAGAHGARFGGGVQRAAGKNVAAKLLGRLRRQQPLRVRGHVAIRQEAVFRLDQHLARRAHQDGAERMVAARASASRHGEGAAQQCLVIDRRHGAIRWSSSRIEFFHDGMENTIGLERYRAKSDSGRVGDRVAERGGDRIVGALAHRFGAEWTH